uniref:Uncharacterized protein n=1 Tax=Leersia perrieri TaxID=77586 RepID=A0A0D9WJP0_9ORYZ
MGRVSIVAGVTLMCIILLVLSSAVTAGEAVRQWEGMESTVAVKGRFRKMKRELFSVLGCSLALLVVQQLQQ